MNCWSDIPRFPQVNYSINVPWNHLEIQLQSYVNDYNLEINPDFQRAHVWTEKQQITFVEYALKIPQSGLHLYFNHPNWSGKGKSSLKDQMVLLDGKQRLNAALCFIRNEIPAYGKYLKDYTHYNPTCKIRPHVPMLLDVNFIFNIMCIPTRKEILEWYLAFNSGGTPHSNEELDRVKEILKKEI
jgi:hypothetical protein